MDFHNKYMSLILKHWNLGTERYKAVALLVANPGSILGIPYHLSSSARYASKIKQKRTKNKQTWEIKILWRWRKILLFLLISRPHQSTPISLLWKPLWTPTFKAYTQHIGLFFWSHRRIIDLKKEERKIFQKLYLNATQTGHGWIEASDIWWFVDQFPSDFSYTTSVESTAASVSPVCLEN